MARKRKKEKQKVTKRKIALNSRKQKKKKINKYFTCWTVFLLSFVSSYVCLSVHPFIRQSAVEERVDNKWASFMAPASHLPVISFPHFTFSYFTYKFSFSVLLFTSKNIKEKFLFLKK